MIAMVGLPVMLIHLLIADLVKADMQAQELI